MLKKSSPIVSVYITNYNYGRYIEEAIRSIFNQTYRDWELFIIDDGSTDNSREIITKFEGADNVFSVFQNNKGLNKTNNVALKLSRGQYIIRLDADDYMDPRALEIMVSEFDKDPELAVVFPDYYLIDECGNVTGQIRRHDFKNEVSLADQPAHGACTMLRREVLVAIGGYDEHFDRQDGYDLWLKIFEKYSVSNINLPLFYYRQHGNNLTKSEEALLKTRAKIKAAHVGARNLPKLSTLGLIPLRGNEIDPRSLPLGKLGNRPLIDWTIDAALDSREIDSVLVATPDVAVQEYVRNRYHDNVLILNRERELARINMPLEPSLKEIIETLGKRGQNYDVMAILFIEAPFRNALYIDKAVHTMRLYDVDVVDGIREEDDIFYVHNGHGLRPWNLNSGLRLERENLYRRVGGLHLVKTQFIKKGNQMLSGRVGHVVLDQKAAFVIRSEMDWEIAQFLATKG